MDLGCKYDPCINYIINYYGLINSDEYILILYISVYDSFRTPKKIELLLIICFKGLKYKKLD